MSDRFANPSSPYAIGRSASRALTEAREHVAALVQCEPSQVVFTSGGTESNNAALHSALRTARHRRHVVMTAVEHACVRRYAERLLADGCAVTPVSVEADGRLDIGRLEEAVTDETAVVSVMAANNETGIVHHIPAAAAIARTHGALFHTDAVQAAGKIPVSMAAWDVDFLAISGHKFHGPKGIGALILRAGLPFEPLLVGGDQERHRRAGTENVAAIAGLGVAARIASSELPTMASCVATLRDLMEQRLCAELDGVSVVGRDVPRLPNTSLLLIRGVETDALLARLDLAGICCSSGSACAAGAHDVSHVLRAMQLPPPGAWGVLRVSLSRFSTRRDADCLVEHLPPVVHELRSLKFGF
jgi:cysteine desulfurase